jgi:phosphoglycolate phosphatase-like HAD superfamily hydrolase
MDCTPSAVLWDMDGTIVDTEAARVGAPLLQQRGPGE